MTWANGLQMVGFTLAHQDLDFLILGMLALGLTHVWLLMVVVYLVGSKRCRRPITIQSVIIAVTGLTLISIYIPYLWWQCLLIRIPNSKISKSDIFVEAAGEGSLGMAKLYLPPKTDLKTINRAFFGACVERQIEIMQFLLKNGADVNCIGDELGETPLMAAAQTGDAEAVTILLARGADPKILEREGETALSLALEYNHPEIAALLRQNGAKATILDAASGGDIESVRAHLKTDPKALNTKDVLGYSPLYHAAEMGKTDVVAVLLAAGANANDFSGNNGWGYSPLLIAAENGHSDVVALLLENGANVNSKCQSEESALFLAAEYGQVEVAKVLLAHGADVNIKGSLMETPLGEAAYSGSKGIAELLIAHKADFYLRDQYGFTPLHMAAYHGHTDVVEALLAAGADINVKDKDGKTPLWEAKSREQNDVADLLRRHGAIE